MDDTETSRHQRLDIAKILPRTASPLKLFALVIMICNSTFAVTAAINNDHDGFVYSIHMFLAIVGAFVMIALWSPRALYHPNELQEIPPEHMPPNRPGVATAVMGLAVFGYAVYQFITD